MEEITPMLAVDPGQSFFRYLIAKILGCNDLRLMGMGESAQNIEAKGVARKILRKKELAPRSASPNPMAGANLMKVAARIVSILFYAFFSVKVVRHRK